MTRARSSVVGLSLVAQLVAVCHMGLVHHDVCAEHGELVEAIPRLAHADIRVAGLHARAAECDADEHCTATALTRGDRPTPSAQLGAPVLVVAIVPSLPSVDRSVAVRAIALLDVAPKHGPPARLR